MAALARQRAWRQSGQIVCHSPVIFGGPFQSPLSRCVAKEKRTGVILAHVSYHATVDLDQWRNRSSSHDLPSRLPLGTGRKICPRTPSPRRSASISSFPDREDGRTTGVTCWRQQRNGPEAEIV